MANTGVDCPGLRRSGANVTSPTRVVPCRSTEGVSFLVSPHVVVGPGRCVDRMDVGADGQARHRRFCPADFLDGHRQGPEDGSAMPLLAHCLVHLAVATALILIIAPRFWFVALIDFAIHITVDRAKGLCASTLGVTLKSGQPVLDADRRRSGAASPDRLRPVDFHGGERLIPSVFESRINTIMRCGPTFRSVAIQPSPS